MRDVELADRQIAGALGCAVPSLMSSESRARHIALNCASRAHSQLRCRRRIVSRLTALGLKRLSLATGLPRAALGFVRAALVEN